MQPCQPVMVLAMNMHYNEHSSFFCGGMTGVVSFVPSPVRALALYAGHLSDMYVP
jgi:hypothetical protein